MFYIVCGEYLNFKYPAFYVSKESQRIGKNWEWKFGFIKDMPKSSDVWYFSSAAEAKKVALQLSFDKSFTKGDNFRKEPRIVELKTSN